MEIKDKNFEFLHSIQIEQKDVVINNLNQIIVQIREKNNDNAIILIRKTLELYLEQIKSVTEINFDSCFSLNDKCCLIKEYISENNLDNNIIHNINSIRLSGNSAAHESRMFLGCESISNLYKLWTVINYFKSYPFSLSNLVFDESIYISEINKNNVDFNVISKSETTVKNPINRCIDVNKYNVYSWLSEKNTRLIIPIYQRHYVWNDKNITVLLEDIDNIKNNQENYEHFFGNISAKIIKINDSLKQIRIIDGQQRLTTSLILVSCIRDIIIHKTHKPIENYDFLMNNDFKNFIENPCKSFEENNFLKRILTPINDKYGWNEKMIDIERHKKTYQIAENYLLIYTYLNNKFRFNINELYEFLDAYLNKFQLSTISFNPDIYDNKKEMEIFENLNSKGTKLELYDLVKNFIFNLCENNLFDVEINAQNLFNEYDDKIRNINKDNLNKFYCSLVEYELCEQLPESENVKFKKIRETILKLLVKWNIVEDTNQKINLSMEQYKIFMKKLGIYANVYASLTNNKKGFENHFLHTYLKLSPILEMMPKKLLSYLTSLSYLLIDVLKYENPNVCLHLSQSDINKIKTIYLDTLKYYIKCHVIIPQGDSNVRRDIVFVYANCINSKTGSISNPKYDLTEKLDFIIDKEQKEFTIDKSTYKYNDFIKNLHLAINSNDIKKSLLMLVEYYMHNRFLSDKNLDYDIQYEHIMPEKYQDWLDEQLRLNPLLNQEQWKQNHDNYVNYLGNGLILAKSLNSSIKNKVFSIKQVKGYCGSTSMLYTNDKLKDIDVKNKKYWTFDDIQKRTNQLAEYIIKNVIKKNDYY